MIFIITIVIFSIIIGLSIYAIIEAVNHKKQKNSYFEQCKETRWGCCPDDFTPKYDHAGSNCININLGE